MSTTWPRQIRASGPDGTSVSLMVTREAVLETLLQHPESLSIQNLLTWLMFAFGALCARPDMACDLPGAQRHEWAGLLRQLAARLEPADEEHAR